MTPQEQIEEHIVEEIVATSVTQMMEEFVEAVKDIPQERGQNRRISMFHVSNPQIREETAEAIQLVPQSQIPDHAEEQSVDASVPRDVEEIGRRIQLIPEGRISGGMHEEIAELPVPGASGAAQNQPLQAECSSGCCHVCLTVQTKEQSRSRALDHMHQEHQEGNCAKQEQNLAARQIWYRFEGRSRPAEVRPGREREAEENAKKVLGFTSEDQIYLVVGGKVVSWEEVTKMEEDVTVEVTCAMRGGGRKKRKERNSWNSSEESSTGGMSTQDEGDEGEGGGLWMKVIRKQLQEWSKKSSENGTMRRFVEQTAQMGPGQRDEAIREYSEALQEFQDEETKEMAVASIRWMVDEKAEEKENAKLK